MSNELTQEQCDKLHEELLKDTLEHQINTGALDLGLPKITCHTCDARFSCPFAYDMYNTNGDCLAGK